MPLKESQHPAGRARDPSRGSPVLRPLGQTAGQQLSKKTARQTPARPPRAPSAQEPGGQARACRRAAGAGPPGCAPRGWCTGAREPAQVRGRPGADLPSQRARSRGPCRPRWLSPSPSCRRRPGPPSRVGEAPALRRPGQRSALLLLPGGAPLRSGALVRWSPPFLFLQPRTAMPEDRSRVTRVKRRETREREVQGWQQVLEQQVPAACGRCHRIRACQRSRRRRQRAQNSRCPRGGVSWGAAGGALREPRGRPRDWPPRRARGVDPAGPAATGAQRIS